MTHFDKPIIVVSAPSGSGKNTIISAVQQKRNDLCYSVSSTTRLPRGKEQHGQNYYFLSEDEFIKRIEQNLFLEWAKVLKYYYGTEKSEITRIHKKEKIPILDLDVQGALQLKEKYPQAIISVFILPPSWAVLKERLLLRGTEPLADIEKRIDLGKQEIKQKDKYDFQIINDELSQTVEQFYKILQSTL